MQRVVPSGHGVNRTTVQIATGSNFEIDFSPLDEVVDHVKGIKTWLNPEAYAKALLSFAAERGDDAEQMLNLLKINPDDMESARGIAHALKGVAGNLAITQVAIIAGEVDAALKSGHLQALDTLLPNLHQALNQVIRNIGKLQLPVTSQAASSSEFDQKVVCRLLGNLCNTLSELNPDAVEPVLAELSKYLSNTELNGIRRAVEGFDFDEASNQSRSLAEKPGLTIE